MDIKITRNHVANELVNKLRREKIIDKISFLIIICFFLV